MSARNIMNTLALGLVASMSLACGYVAPSEGDETGGDPKPNQDPPDGPNPPEWHCRTRIPGFSMVTTQPGTFDLDEIVVDAHDAEVCAYAMPSGNGDPIPGKPWWFGLPSLGDDHPIVLNGPVQHLHPMWVYRSYTDLPWEQSGAQLRSGLIGNFAVWLTPSMLVPDEGHRPPIVRGRLFDQFLEMITSLPVSYDPWEPKGNVSTTGRYPVYGHPCSTKRATTNYHLVPSVVNAEINLEAAECEAFIEYDGIRSAHYLYSLPGDVVMEDVASENAMCLDNGGQYHPLLASFTAGERDGLVWINFSEIDKLQDLLVTLIAPELELSQETLELIQNAIAFVDWLESVGFTWNVWPINPEWPWSNFSFTGTCAFPVQLDLDDVTGAIITRIPCPSSYMAVLPDFSPPDLPVEDEDFWTEFDSWRVNGYCTLPFQELPPMKNSVEPTIVDEITIGKFGHGFSGAIFAERLQDETIDKLPSWLDLVDSHDGVIVEPLTIEGEQLLQSANIPAGSTVIATEELANPTALELAADVGRSLSSGRIAMIVLDAPDGKRLHRYIVPSLGMPDDRQAN